MGMGMGIDQWEWEGIGILIVFPHTSTYESDFMSLLRARIRMNHHHTP